MGLSIITHGGKNADSEFAESTRKLGVALGGFASIRLHERVSLQPELLYATKGTDAELDGQPVSTVRMSYVEIPVLARVLILPRARMQPYALLGPALGLLLGAEVEGAVSGNITDLTDDTRLFDLGLTMGVGAAWALSSMGSFTLEARYNLGLISVDDSVNQDDIKNRALTFFVGYQY